MRYIVDCSLGKAYMASKLLVSFLGTHKSAHNRAENWQPWQHFDKHLWFNKAFENIYSFLQIIL